jgi:hypothetical protein
MEPFLLLIDSKNGLDSRKSLEPNLRKQEAKKIFDILEL